MPNQNELNAMLESISKQLGTTPQNLQQSAQSGQLDKMIRNMNQTDTEKLQQVLSNPEEANRLLNTPQAQKLMKMLMGGK